MSTNLYFQKSQNKNVQNDSLVESLEKLGGQILWRKSERHKTNHFVLRADISEKDVSLFLSTGQIEDNGRNFLIFFFTHPARSAFTRKKDKFNLEEIRESIVVSFYPKKLITIINSSSKLKDKLMKLELSKRQKYAEHATHYSLFFYPKDNGGYYDLDDDVLLALSNCSKINPDEQEKDYAFIDEIINECKKQIFFQLSVNDDTETEKDNKEKMQCLLENFPDLNKQVGE